MEIPNVGGAWELRRKEPKPAKAKLLSHAAYRVAVVPVVVVRGIDVRTVEVQVVGVVAIVDRRRPIVAVRTDIVQRAIVHVARTDKPQGANQAASCPPTP